MRRATLLILVLLAVIPAVAQTRIRECVNLGGLYGWFPADRRTLERDVDGYLADADDVELEGAPVAIVAPHSGYKWSGSAMGYAFKPLLGKECARVVVLAPPGKQ